MDIYFIPTLFFTLFFVVDPLGLIPVFMVYLSGYEKKARRWIIIKSVSISIAVSVFFILLGKYLLKFLGIAPGSFLIAGGILLFIISLEMLFGKASKVKMRDYCDDETPQHGHDVSVFPLAIPMLCGPGNIAALVMFSTQAGGNAVQLSILIGVSILIFLIAMAVMFFSTALSTLLGDTGISILQRLMGLILSALSVQFIINGLINMKIIG